MTNFFRRFRKSVAGVSAIEFALVAPLMLFTFFGIAEIANYVLAARKVANVASTAADLVTQDTSVDDTEMADILGALDVIMRPFNTTNAKVRITQIVAQPDGDLVVDWSDARNWSPRTEGSPAPSSMPGDIVPENQGVIMAEVEFTYSTPFGMYLTDGMTVSDTFYLKPRRSTTVDRE